MVCFYHGCKSAVGASSADVECFNNAVKRIKNWVLTPVDTRTGVEALSELRSDGCTAAFNCSIQIRLWNIYNQNLRKDIDVLFILWCIHLTLCVDCSREWCARLGEQCVPETKLKFADCCPGYRCHCSTFVWKSSKCTCKQTSKIGR